MYRRNKNAILEAAKWSDGSTEPGYPPTNLLQFRQWLEDLMQRVPPESASIKFTPFDTDCVMVTVERCDEPLDQERLL